MSIRLSSEELNKERERQRKKGNLILKTLKKGKINVDLNDPDVPNRILVFRYQIHDANVDVRIDHTEDNMVRSLVVCDYDNIDIFNEDGSEITKKLPLWLVAMIESELIEKFDKFNIELWFRQSNNGKQSILMENEDEDQKMIHKAKLIYKALRKGKVEFTYSYVYGSTPELKTINWTLPNKFILKVKKYDYLFSQKSGKEKYVVLVLNSQNIDIVTNDGKRLTNNENLSMIMKINEQFKKHNITVYWSGGGSGLSPDNDATEIDLTPKSK
jgi:hypothetical protein